MTHITLTDGRTPIVTSNEPVYVGSADISKIYTQVQAQKRPNDNLLQVTVLASTDMKEPLNMSGVAMSSQFIASQEDYATRVDNELNSIISLIKGESIKNTEVTTVYIKTTMIETLLKMTNLEKSSFQGEVDYILMNLFANYQQLEEKIKILEKEHKTLIDTMNK
jgi:hypothetical protein